MYVIPATYLHSNYLVGMCKWRSMTVYKITFGMYHLNMTLRINICSETLRVFWHFGCIFGFPLHAPAYTFLLFCSAYQNVYNSKWQKSWDHSLRYAERYNFYDDSNIFVMCHIHSVIFLMQICPNPFFKGKIHWFI